jgi:hypothetical protein
MARFILFFWKAALGMLLCLTPFTAVLVVGWVTRAMERRTAIAWFKRSSFAGRKYRLFAKDTQSFALVRAWPNWILAQEPARLRAAARENPPRARGRVALWIRLAVGSLWENLIAGIAVVANTWVLTLPAGALWLLSWWGGWENSFNKGYEQAWVGPTIAGVGILAFIIAMFHVPLAQARQASARSWRAYYDFALVRTLRASRRIAFAFLAAGFAIAGVIIAGLHAGPLALGNYLKEIGGFSPGEYVQIGQLYHLGSAAVIFVLLLALRLAAARLYAGAVLKGVKSGDILPLQLSPPERARLADLDLLAADDTPAGNIVVRAAKFSGRSVIAIATTAATAALWFALVSQLYVAQFLNHHWLAWVNLPMIQVPWMQ